MQEDKKMGGGWCSKQGIRNDFQSGETWSLMLGKSSDENSETRYVMKKVWEPVLQPQVSILLINGAYENE